MAARFEIKKLLRQKVALAAEGYAQMRQLYVEAWKEAERKAMHVNQVGAVAVGAGQAVSRVRERTPSICRDDELPASVEMMGVRVIIGQTAASALHIGVGVAGCAAYAASPCT